MNASLIDKIVAFGEKDEDIRAVILEGSVTTNLHVDELSDYDVNIFSRNFDKFLADDRWMRRFGEVMLYQKEEFQFYATFVPTRLVVFCNRERVDFSFWSLSLLTEMVRGNKQYESYKNGYQILVDKDHLAKRLKPPDGTGFQIIPPERDRFLRTIYDFWFEAYCVARYLARGDLWFAKRIENSFIKDHFYQMALWQHQSEHGWKPDPLLHLEGKRFEKWASPDLIQGIERCFSSYQVESTWSSLLTLADLFGRLARQTASQLDIEFPERVENELLDYLAYLKSN